MISRLTGAILRAVLVMLLVITPGLLVPGVTSDSAQFAAFIGLFVGALVFIEYSSSTPIMIEFRDAPPFNRIRFAALFVIVFLITALMRGAYYATPLAELVYTIGTSLGQLLDFTYSPVRMVVVMLPNDASTHTMSLMRAAAGVSYVLSITATLGFLAYTQIFNWPGRNGQFNVLTNLPMFDPTSGGDVVERLSRGARINILLGLLVPFIIPICIKSSGIFIDPLNFENPQTLIWVMSLWAFLPVSMIMRGIAMARLVHLITVKRRQRYAEAHEEGLYA